MLKKLGGAALLGLVRSRSLHCWSAIAAWATCAHAHGRLPP